VLTMKYVNPVHPRDSRANGVAYRYLRTCGDEYSPVRKKRDSGPNRIRAEMLIRLAVSFGVIELDCGDN